MNDEEFVRDDEVLVPVVNEITGTMYVFNLTVFSIVPVPGTRYSCMYQLQVRTVCNGVPGTRHLYHVQ